MSLFITFEGGEGSGKTTQIEHLAVSLRQQGLAVVTTREPGGCAIADAIRAILLDPGNRALVPRAELLLYAAARAQHVEEVIRPALAAEKIVLCDRYTDATLAYQGWGRGLDRTLIADLNVLAADGAVPDLTLLLDLPVAEGLARARQRNRTTDNVHEDRFEQETLAFHQAVRQGYLQLAETDERFQIIDALGPPDTVAERIARAVAPHIRRRRPA